VLSRHHLESLDPSRHKGVRRGPENAFLNKTRHNQLANHCRIVRQRKYDANGQRGRFWSTGTERTLYRARGRSCTVMALGLKNRENVENQISTPVEAELFSWHPIFIERIDVVRADATLQFHVLLPRKSNQRTYWK